MLQVAFAGTFPASLEQPVRRHLTTRCGIIVATEADILPRLPAVDVLVTMGLTAEMGRAATRLKLVQVPGAGTDRSIAAVRVPRRLDTNERADLQARVRPRNVPEARSIQAADLHVLDRLGLYGKVGGLRPGDGDKTRR